MKNQMDSREKWIASLREFLAKAHQVEPIPERGTLSDVDEIRCRILGGHLISWLDNWGPKLIQERNLLAQMSGWEKNPHIVFATDNPGIVAAQEILDPLPDAITFCRKKEYSSFRNLGLDEKYTYHCTLESYFENMPTVDDDREIRKQHNLPPDGELWLHHDCSTMGITFARGGKHLWHFSNGEPNLVMEGFKSWVS